jgi:hypothetical protein
VTLEEEQGNFFSSKIRNIHFIDPYDPIDAKYPTFKSRGCLDTFPPITSFFRRLLSYEV